MVYTKFMTYYKPTPLFRADVGAIAHGLIIRTIRYTTEVYRVQSYIVKESQNFSATFWVTL